VKRHFIYMIFLYSFTFLQTNVTDKFINKLRSQIKKSLTKTVLLFCVIEIVVNLKKCYIFLYINYQIMACAFFKRLNTF